MIKKFVVSSLAVAGLVISGAANAQWKDVEYNAFLKKDYIYCTSQGNLDEFGGFAQDGDNAGANRMIENGKCRVSSGMKIQVFQENDYAVTFLAPSGKAFYTLKGWLVRK